MAESNIAQKVRDSALYVTENATDVKINRDVMNQFVDNMEMEKFINLQPPFSLPLRFDTLEEEVNLISLIDLINFASGWRKELHACLDRGAYESITYGCLGMHISGKRLTADFLASLSISDIADYFGIPIHKESELQPGISTFVEHELRPLATLLQKVLNDTGNILKSKGFATLGLFVLDLVSKSSSALVFVEKLVETFPAFGDKANYKGKEVFIIKKAQLLAGDLYRNFKSRDKRFDFVDISQLTIFTDNVVPAVLRKLGILELSEELSEIVDNAKELPVGDKEVELRLVAVRACQEIVEKAKDKYKEYKDIKEFNEMMLDYYLWLKGKEPEFRKVERHYTKATVFY